MHSNGTDNKCKELDHILGTGVAARGVNITYSDVPLYPRTSASAPSNASKSVNQQASKDVESQSGPLMHAQFCERVGEEHFEKELDKAVEFLKKCEFGKKKTNEKDRGRSIEI